MEERLMAKCACEHCGNHIEFPIEGADAVVPCPHCRKPTRLDLETPAPASHRPPAAELLAGFTGSLSPTPVATFYRLALGLVALMMVLLPLVYLAMVAAVLWGVVAYAVHFAPLLGSFQGGPWAYLGKMLIYLVPLSFGCGLIFLMVKPLFAPRAPRPQTLAMNPAVESTLFAFIARICELVGAPMPRRIDLDCQLNASAGFRGGIASTAGNDLVLTIGLPLVAGLTLREFAGVIAHEFGHFTQGLGMRLSYVIRSINEWFARVVYERDTWELRLEAWSMQTEDLYAAFIAGFARLAVGISRLPLRALMFLSHAISCLLLRQMEYDADSYEIKLAGSATFETTAQRFAVLREVLNKTYKEIRATWNTSRRLPDSLPAFLLKMDSLVTPERRQRLRDQAGFAQAGWFHTHPSDAERIQRARAAAEPGLFHLELPASVLFSNFRAVSKQVTQLHYRDDLDLDFDSANLRPVDS